MAYNFEHSGPREIFVGLDEALKLDDAAERRAAFDALQKADSVAADKALDMLEEKLIRQADRAGERARNALVQEESLQAQPSRLAELREYQAGLKNFFRSFEDLHIAADGLVEIDRAKKGDVQPFTQNFVADYSRLSPADQFDPENVARIAARTHQGIEDVKRAEKEVAREAGQQEAADKKAEAQKELKAIAEKRKHKSLITKSYRGPTVC